MVIHRGTDKIPRFGELVRRHRLRIGLTQRELADLSTVSVRAIRDLERGKVLRPRQGTVRLIADGLRLGRQARSDLAAAATQGRPGLMLWTDYDPALAPPPTAMDAIIGRESEIAALEHELSGDHGRLVTVVGLCGVGKSRLALEVAARLHVGARTPVLWLAAPGVTPMYGCVIRDKRLADLARACVDEIFGSVPGRGRAASEKATTDLAELVADRRTLLVVDGLDVHPSRPELLLRLLQDCPELRVLVTSTRPCGLPGERTFVLSPLPPPTNADQRDVASLCRVAAVRLFLDHARPVRPDYRLTTPDIHVVAEICLLLDGLPSALQSAASWLSVYGPRQLLRTLRNDPAALLDRDGLERCLAELPAAEQELLGWLCDNGEHFTLDDVVALTGLSALQAGLSLRRLLVHGAVRSHHADGQGSLHVLNLVRAVVGTPHELARTRA